MSLIRPGTDRPAGPRLGCGPQLGLLDLLSAREHREACEEILIRQSGRGDEDVCLHASSCITAFFVAWAGPWEDPGAPPGGPFGRATTSAQKRLGGSRTLPHSHRGASRPERSILHFRNRVRKN